MAGYRSESKKTEDKNASPDEALLKEATDRFQIANEYYSEEYQRAEEDYNFLIGDQWPQEIKSDRIGDGRPCLTENRLLPFANQTINEIRKARPTITVHPVDSNADIDTAEILQGMIRNIEVQSDAESAYDTAALSSVGSGYGYLRVNTRYIEGTFDQEIVIDRILNPFSVYLDPNHKRLDGQDCEWGFVFDDMATEDFEKKWPDVSLQGWNEGYQSMWLTDKSVRVAEYFYREYEKTTLVKTEEVGVVTLEEFESLSGLTEIERRVEEISKIKWCKLVANEILEKTDWEGRYIPIVPILGQEVWHEGRKKVYSLIYQAKEPQQMHNFWKSASTEIIALQPKAPFIGAVGQFETNQVQWRDANRENYAVLQYDPIDFNGNLTPPPQRQPPPQPSMAMVQESMMAIDGIKATLGMFDASMGQQGNEISGTAIAERKEQGSNANYHFMDNLATALKQVGNILVDLIPKIYTGARIERIIGVDGEDVMVPINQAIIKDEKGNKIAATQGVASDQLFKHDITLGKYDIIVDVGPSYSTKRQEVVNTMLEIANVYPQIMEIAPDILFTNLDIPNAQKLAERIKSVMDPVLLGDDPTAAKLQQASEAMGQMEQQITGLQAQLKEKADNQAFENQIKEKETNIDAIKTKAEVKHLDAKTDQIRVEIGQGAIDNENDKDILADAVEKLATQVASVTGAVSNGATSGPGVLPN